MIANFIFLSTDKLTNFAGRREAERRSLITTFCQVGLTPVRVIHCASISATVDTLLEGTTSPSTKPLAQVSRTPPPPRPTDHSKGKQLAVAPSKRTLDEGELEKPRKRPQGIRLSNPTELRDVALLQPKPWYFVPHKEKALRGLLSFPWTRNGFKLLESRRDLEGLALEIQRASPPLSNLQLSNSQVGRLFCKIVLHRMMDHDLSQNLCSDSMGVDNTMGHIGAHLSQVNSHNYIFFLC